MQRLTVFVLTAFFAASFGIQLRSFPGNDVSNAREGPESYALQNGPINLADFSGVNKTLTCSANSSTGVRVMWAEYVTNLQGAIISDGPLVLPGHPNAARYTIINDGQTQFDLMINEIVFEDGGTYLCQDVNAGAPDFYRGQAELTVFETAPNCSTTLGSGTTLEGQNHTMECIVDYGGNYAPTLTFSGPPPFRVATVTTPNSVWSGIDFTIDRSMTSQAFSCLMNFTELPSTYNDGVATNPPDFQFINNFIQMFVYWGPKNMYIDLIKTTYEVGDIINCFADAFPAPFYQWQNLRSLETISGQSFTVDVVDVGFTSLWRCLAQNLIQGFVYQANFFVNVTVPAPTTTASPTTPTTTTPAPAVASCDFLTGRWQANDPTATLCMTVDASNGRLTGLVRNATDNYFIEINGRTLATSTDTLGFNGIWPLRLAVSGFAGECHNCFGTERILVDTLSRSNLVSPDCGIPGPFQYSASYTFFRVSGSCTGSTMNVYRPTKISQNMGVNVIDVTAELDKTF